MIVENSSTAVQTPAKTVQNIPINILRAVCATLVMILHCFTHVRDPLTNVFIDQLHILAHLAVPCFFMISAYYYSRHLFENQKTKWHHCGRTLKRLATSYFIWASIKYLFEMILALIHHETIGGALLTSLDRLIHSWLWYFPVLMLWVCISTCFNWEKRKTLISLLLVLVALLFNYVEVTLNYFYKPTTDDGFAQIFQHPYFNVIVSRPFCRGMLYFFLGFLIRSLLMRKTVEKHKYLFIYAIIALVLNQLEVNLAVHVTHALPEPGPVSYCMPFAVCFLFLSVLLCKPRYQIKEKHGTNAKYYSSTLYYIHPFANFLLSYAQRFLMNDVQIIFYRIGSMILIAAGSFVLAFIMRRTRCKLLLKIFA